MQGKGCGQVGLNQGPRSIRDEYLTAVPGTGYPSGPVNVDTHIVAAGELSLSGMQAHSDPNGDGKRLICESALNLCGGIQGAQGASKDHEERIAFRGDLDSVGLADDLPEYAVVLLQEGRVVTTEFLEKPGGSLDIGEEEGNGAAWQLGCGHGPCW